MRKQKNQLPSTPPTGQGFLVGRTYFLALRVYYEDTDAGGIVYHANYLRFMERCRSEYLRHVKTCMTEKERQSWGQFVVRKITLSYDIPAFLDDWLMVSARLVSWRGALAVFVQEIARAGQKLVTAHVTVAHVKTPHFQISGGKAPPSGANRLRPVRLPLMFLRAMQGEAPQND